MEQPAGSVGSTQLASGLTLGGTTSGTFSGNGAALTNLNGANITTASVHTAQLASGLTLGGITSGTFSGNGAGLTSLVASNIASGTIANAQTSATSSGTANTIVLRDTNGSFTAGTVTLSGNLALPVTSSANAGVITLGSLSVLHAFGAGGNFFAGLSAGNFTLSGSDNTGIGAGVLSPNTTGSFNVAVGYAALTSIPPARTIRQRGI